MITKEKLISIGSERLADILLSLYENHKDVRKHLDIAFAGLSEDPKKIISMLKKEISALKRSKKFVDYYESKDFADRLNQLRLGIAGDLTQKSPPHALELILEFLDLHDSTLNRVDDSNGSVGDVFREACRDLGKIYEHAPKPMEEIVDLVFKRFMNNEYGVYDELIHHLKRALNDEGLKLLQKKLEDAHNTKNDYKISHGLKDIADCQKDVDAYIRACSFTGKPSNHDHLDIAKRLIEHWRSEEALQWLDTMNIPSDHGWHQDRRRLKIEALELKGDYEKAQTERLNWFEETLSPDLYGQILKHAKPEFKEPFRKEAIEKAFRFQEPHLGLGFLMRIQEFEEGAKLVRLKSDQLHGRQYYTLRPTAEILSDVDPLAATLVYRKLIESVLEKTQSKYYAYAAKDLVTCGILSPKITDWGPYQNHESYFKSLEEKNKRKVSFWAEYKSALQKQAAKEAKQAAKKEKQML